MSRINCKIPGLRESDKVKEKKEKESKQDKPKFNLMDPTREGTIKFKTSDGEIVLVGGPINAKGIAWHRVDPKVVVLDTSNLWRCTEVKMQKETGGYVLFLLTHTYRGVSTAKFTSDLQKYEAKSKDNTDVVINLSIECYVVDPIKVAFESLTLKDTIRTKMEGLMRRLASAKTNEELRVITKKEANEFGPEILDEIEEKTGMHVRVDVIQSVDFDKDIDDAYKAQKQAEEEAKAELVKANNYAKVQDIRSRADAQALKTRLTAVSEGLNNDSESIRAFFVGMGGKIDNIAVYDGEELGGVALKKKLTPPR